MRMRRTQYIAAGLVRLPDVADVTAPAFEEAQILLPAGRLTDRLQAHIPTPCLKLTAPAAGTAADRGETMSEAGAKTPNEPVIKTARKPVLEMPEPLHDDDGRREAKKPRLANPIRKKLGVGIIDGIGILVRIRRRSRRRHLVGLHRQSRRSLRDLPAPVGLRTRLDGRLPRPPAHCDLRRVSAARGPVGWRLAWLQRHARVRRGALAGRFQGIGLGRQPRGVLHDLPTAVRLLTRLALRLLRTSACRHPGGKVVAYGLRLLRQGSHLRTSGGMLASSTDQYSRQDRDDANHWHSSIACCPLPSRSAGPALSRSRGERWGEGQCTVCSSPRRWIVGQFDQQLAEIAALQQADER